MDCCKIYIIYNNANTKVYVGQTWEILDRRFCKHKTNKKSGCLKLKRAFKKYGINNFNIKLITISHTQEIADYWEKYFIAKYNSISEGYNLQEGGSHGKHSRESKEKMSKSQLGKIIPNAVRSKISKSLKGIVRSQETRNKMSNNRNGIIFSQETKKRMSDSQLGKILSPETRKKISIAKSGEKSSLAKLNWKIVDQIRLDFKTGLFKHKDLGEKYGVCESNIGCIVRNKTWIK